MFERYSLAAERAARLAQSEARRLGHNMTGPEHLAVGLIADEREPASAALRSFGLDRDRLRRAAGAVHPPEAPGASVAVPPFNAAAQGLIETARRDALNAGRAGVEPADLLLALLDDDAGVAVLGTAGVDAGRARQAVQRIRS
ncbi:MAG TPA: Clp protease N-terminal domain-containing protein, partial [Acidimicrobiales bacterium]